MANVAAGTRALAWTAGKMARSWKLGKVARSLSKAAGKIMPSRQGRALQLAAKRSGFERYEELMLSHQNQDHTSEIVGDQVVSIYFAFGFHFAFVTGLFFPQFMQKAIENPGLFYAQEVSSSAGIATALTLLMLTGRMGTTARTAFKTANLSEHIEKEWNEAMDGGILKRLKFYLSVFKIPFGGFPGVDKEGLSFTIDGESPLKVSASGPRLWDGIVAKVAWGISLPLITLSVFASQGSLEGLPETLDWLGEFANSNLHEGISRIFVPLAFISSLGKRLIGSGVFKTHVIDRDLTRWDPPKTRGGRTFDMTSVKSQLIKGGEE